MTHIYVNELNIIGSNNGLSPGRRQAIIWTSDGILLIGPLATNFSEILAEIITVSFKKMYLKVSSVKWRPFCLGLNVLKMIFQQVFSYFTNNKLLYENQYGFRKHHSTELAAIVPIDRNFSYMDTGKIPICIFLDSPKAFDDVDRSILLDELKHYGFDKAPLKWFHSYLKDRSQYVVFNGIYSDVINLSTGFHNDLY